MSEITNPYRPGEPVTTPAKLFGRQEAADWVELQISNNARTLILSGQPLIGKTSFIQHVGALQNLETFNLFVSLPGPSTLPEQVPDKQKKRSREKQSIQAVIDTILQQVVEQLTPQLTQLDLASAQPIGTSTPATTVMIDLFTQANRQLGQTRLLIYLDDLHRLITDDMASVAAF